MTGDMLRVARSSFATSMARYGRSWGLWLLLLVAPVAARVWIRPADSDLVVIAVDGRSPLLTSAMLGLTLGVVISTILVPVAFIYLRANVTRVQPWQIEEVAPAPRVGIALGRFAADVAILFAALFATTLAGWVIAGVVPLTDAYHPGHIALALWLIAAPALMGIAALRIMFDAVPATRGVIGDILFFVAWMASLLSALVGAGDPGGGLAANMYDFPGFATPLTAGFADGIRGISIGATSRSGGTVTIDVMRNIASPGYAASRLIWAVLAIEFAILAGLVYRPHRALRQARKPRRLARLFQSGPPPAAMADAPFATAADYPAIGLIAVEARLIARGRLWLLLATLVSLSGLVADYCAVVGPAGLLLLVFGLTAHAARAEQAKLLTLAGTMAMSPMSRRLAFVAAGTGLSLALAAPAITIALFSGDGTPLLPAAGTGVVASVVAILLAAASRSAFAPRIVLLIGWYGYLASA